MDASYVFELTTKNFGDRRDRTVEWLGMSSRLCMFTSIADQMLTLAISSIILLAIRLPTALIRTLATHMWDRARVIGVAMK